MRGLTRRLRRIRRLILTAAVVAAVSAVTDWPIDVFGVKWADHPIWAGVLTGALILVAGYFGLELYMKTRDEQRWDRVKAVGLKALGVSANSVRDGMDRLLGGGPVYAVPADSAFLAGFIEPMRDLLGKHTTLDALKPFDHLGRLGVVLECSECMRFIRRGLDFVKHHQRDRLASWSGVLLASDRMAPFVDRAAQLDDRLSELQQAIDDFRGLADGDRATAKDRLVERWDDVVTSATELQEDLVRATGPAEWKHPSRARLSERGRARLEERDAAGAVS